MKRALLLALLLAALGLARPLYVLAESEGPCQQVFYEPPDWADPNLVQGIILPAIPASATDPNAYSYEAPVGDYDRIAMVCDPEGDPFVITCQSDGWEALFDPIPGVWVLEGVVQPGPNYVYVRAKDDPGPYRESKISYYTVLIWGIPPENRAPILY